MEDRGLGFWYVVKGCNVWGRYLTDSFISLERHAVDEIFIALNVDAMKHSKGSLMPER